jgi:hypothetical protein
MGSVTPEPDDATKAGPTSHMSGVGPWSWTVTWGVLARPGFAVEHVLAWDADEALVLAAQRHPERERPRVAFLTVPSVELSEPVTARGGGTQCRSLGSAI